MRRTTARPAGQRVSRWRRMLLALACAGLLAAALAGCGDSSAPPYGGSQNHLHDILALVGVSHTVLLATHIGLYRTADGGRSWSEVAGGAGQKMDGLMIFKLAQSPLEVKRVYVLAVPRPDNPAAAKDKPGIYTSADAGQTWSLAAPASSFPTANLFSIGAGGASATQLFAIVPGLAAKGLYVSDDAGAHWRQEPQLPVTSLKGVQGDAQNPQRVWLWSVSTGLYVSNDNAASWSAVSDITGGISSLWQSGATLYANGDSGVFVSTDDGVHFTAADPTATYDEVIACAGSPDHAWAQTGTTIFTSSDGGRSWKPTAATSEHPTLLAADPSDPNAAYVSFSYPLGVQVTTDGGKSWKQTLP
jgi:photosystem II stability/assembly factor-like uncharacterized protein